MEELAIFVSPHFNQGPAHRDKAAMERGTAPDTKMSGPRAVARQTLPIHTLCWARAIFHSWMSAPRIGGGPLANFSVMDKWGVWSVSSSTTWSQVFSAIIRRCNGKGMARSQVQTTKYRLIPSSAPAGIDTGVTKGPIGCGRCRAMAHAATSSVQAPYNA